MKKFALIIACMSAFVNAMQLCQPVYDKQKTEQLKEVLNAYHPASQLPKAIIMRLVIANADPNIIADVGYYDGCSWLHALVPEPYIFADPGILDLIRFFLYYGADPNIQDPQMQTVFLKAIVKGRYDIALKVYQDTHDINIPDYYGNTFLHQLVLRGKVKDVQFWLTKGGYASLAVMNKAGQMPKDITPLVNALEISMALKPQKIR